MKIYFNLFLISLYTCLFFSCTEIEQVEKRILSHSELETLLDNSQAFTAYINLIQSFDEEIRLKTQDLRSKDSKWLNDQFKKFPTLEVFLDKNLQSSINKFVQISGIDIVEGAERLDQKFMSFSKPIYEKYSFEEADLSRIILNRINHTAWQKNSFGTCETYCSGAAEEEYHRVEAECKKENGTYCRSRAIMARTYFKRGCLRGCKYQ